jgi:hypothetical protein
MKKVQGFLLITALVIIAIVSVMSILLVDMYVGKNRATKNVGQSNVAFYIATSGLEIAKRDFFKNGIACVNIAGPTYTGIGFPPGATSYTGYYTVGGSVLVTTLPSDLNNTSTSIVLSNVSGFPLTGAVIIENEVISYNGIDKANKTLKNAVRGAYGTLAVAHLANKSVTTLCILTATGYAPTVSNAIGRRTLQQEVALLAGSGNAFGSLLDASGNPITPALVSAGAVNLSGTNVINSLIATGSTFAFSGSLNFGGSTPWYSWYEGCPMPPSSNLITGDSNINAANFFNYFYTNQITDFQNVTGAKVLTPGVNNIPTELTNYNSSGVIYVNGNLTLSGYNNILQNATGAVTLAVNGNVTISGCSPIAKSNTPVAILATGTVNLSGYSSLYGLVYSNSNVTISGSTFITGAVAAKGTVNTSGYVNINYDQNIINLLNLSSGGSAPIIVSLPEAF